MKNYNPIEKIISNENVIHVLNSAKLFGEGSLLVNVAKRDLKEDIYEIYVPPKDYNSETDKLTFLAIVTKKKEKIKNWYIRFEGNWKADIS